ncbi:hypothetical protein [Komagataeibacter sp. FXV3]|uniref:hypothetical protein n=1 Tax=Komagataeibacter sp. FXV3 TaxID=2608998 RepID=UPI00187B6324|nr:hypothetical protein [Komagataeibacter sp. FXV3]MBE7729430.1 hypothetical protein [Komagataeibacter sp. FXV3]
MAVTTITVSTERRDAGYELLRKTDDLGFDAIGAGWYQAKEAGRWRFFLVTPMIDSQGPRWVYDQLMAALRIVKIPDGIKPLEIHLVSPQEERFYDLRKLLHVPTFPQDLFHIHGPNVEKLGIYAMVLYRMKDMNNRAGDTARQFAAKVRELEDA